MDAPSQKDLFPAQGMSMTVLELFRSHALSLPSLAKFTIAMAAIVGVPWLSRRVRHPLRWGC